MYLPSLAQLHRNVRVLTEDDDVLHHQGQIGGQAEALQKVPWSDPIADRKIDRQQDDRVEETFALAVRLRKQSIESRQIPVILQTVQNGKQREPQSPTNVDRQAFPKSQFSWHERGGRRIEILPTGPSMVSRMHQDPTVEGDASQQRGDVSTESVEEAMPEQRLVSSLMDEHKPLKHGQGQ